LGQLVAERERITREGKAVRARIDRLAAEAGSTCPLCGQVMTDDHRASVIAQWNVEHEERVTAYRQTEGERLRREAEKEVLADALRKWPRLQAELSAAQNDLAQRKARLQQVDEAIAARDSSTTAAQLAELEKLLADDAELLALKEQVQLGATAKAKREALERERATLQERVARAGAQLEQIDAIMKRWTEVEAPALAATRQQLQDGNYAAEAQMTLADVDRQLAELGYDPAAHEAARRSRAELAGADADYQELRAARDQVKILEDLVADLEARQKHWQDQAAETEAQHRAAEALWRSLSADLTELDAVEREVSGLRDAVVEAVRRAGSARQAVAVLEDQRQRRSGLVVEHKQATQMVTQLRVLEDSFGRKGIQAWLIEMALPEIEDRANTLLDRLSNGAMRVSFSTQKKLKSKDAVAETLDITIADGVGERPYENYSGGEKFRINFAIRLALSQVLAHRAGTQLRTLVIDEGFGSQDPEGRQRLVEAINLVQNEFACILVITHVDELRDAFPARIEVEKTAAGSQVKVVVA
jgi:exonuclease SbcC